MNLPPSGYEVGRLRLSGDNEVTHRAAYCVGGMLRRVSNGKPVEMQLTDNEKVYSVSEGTKLKFITRLETTISELQAE